MKYTFWNELTFIFCKCFSILNDNVRKHIYVDSNFFPHILKPHCDLTRFLHKYEILEKFQLPSKPITIRHEIQVNLLLSESEPCRFWIQIVGLRNLKEENENVINNFSDDLSTRIFSCNFRNYVQYGLTNSDWIIGIFFIPNEN